LFQSCLTNRLVFDEEPEAHYEDDDVKRSKRARLEMVHNNDEEPRTPFLDLKQTLLVEKNRGEPLTIRMYEVLNLSQEAFALEDSLYLIIDKRAHVVKMQGKAVNGLNSLETSTETVMKNDDSTVDVISGFSQTQINQYKFSYEIDNRLARRIASCRQLSFRYYAGPHMMTVKLSANELARLKRIVN